MTEEQQNRAEEPLNVANGIIRYVALLWQFRWFVIIPTAVAGLATVAFAVISIVLPPDVSPLPNRYRSEATILMNTPEVTGSAVLSSVFSAFNLSDNLGIGGSTGIDYGVLALEVLRSPVILDQLAAEFDVAERFEIEEVVVSRSREVLLEMARVSLNRETGILRVSYESIDPVFAQALTTRTVELLNEWFRSTGSAAQSRQLSFLEAKVAEVSETIGRLEAEVQSFQSEHGIVSVQGVAETQERMLADLRTRLVLKEMEIKNYQQFSTIEDPTLARLRSERNNLRSVIEEIERGETSLYGEAAPDGKSLAQLSQEFAEISTQLRIQRSLYESLLERYELARVAQEQAALFQVIQAAEIPDQKSGPRRSRLVIQNTLVVFLLSVVGVALYDAIRRVIGDRERIRKIVAGELEPGGEG